ncbi:O-antigen ligase family protein [Candidatus Saccharibacteria bacterium]|nr:O-antigen ligase family protein [Candidatus Saccharibacteria bacterium]
MGKTDRQSINTVEFYRSFFKVGPLGKFLSWAAAFIFVLLPFHALLTTWAGSNTGHLDLWRIWKEIIIAILVVPATYLLSSSTQLRNWFRRSWLPRLIGLYFLLHLALAIWALAADYTNTEATTYALIINLRFLTFFLICLIIASHSDWLKRHWAKLLLIPAGLVVLFGLLQKLILPYDWLRHFGYRPDTTPAYQTVDASLDFKRIQSTLRGANPLGAYLTMVIPAAMMAIKRNWIFKTGLLIGSIYVLFFSYSRSAWIGTALALALLAWWSVSHARRQNLVLLIAAAAVLISAGGYYLAHYNQAAQKTLFHTNASSSSTASSNAERVAALKRGASDIIHQPLGRGPGTAGPASFRNDGHQPRVAENYYLQIGQEAGMLGIALFAAINILLARELWRQRRDILAKLLLASLAGISFINLVSHAWTDDTLSLMWWGLAGIALGTALVNNKLKPSSELSRIRFRRLSSLREPSRKSTTR